MGYLYGIQSSQASLFDYSLFVNLPIHKDVFVITELMLAVLMVTSRHEQCCEKSESSDGHAAS